MLIKKKVGTSFNCHLLNLKHVIIIKISIDIKNCLFDLFIELINLIRAFPVSSKLRTPLEVSYAKPEVKKNIPASVISQERKPAPQEQKQASFDWQV